MAQRRFLFLGLVAVLALVITGTIAVRELTPTSARTTDATMSITVTAGGPCAAGVCTIPLSGALTVSLNAVVPPSEGYVGIQTELAYGSLVYKPIAAGDEIVWPPSALPLRGPSTTPVINHADATGVIPPFPSSTFAGPLVVLQFTCTAGNTSNVLELVPRAADNTNGSGFKSAGAGNPSLASKASTLTVNCGAATTPTSAPPTNTPGPTSTAAPPTETPTVGPTVPPTVTPTAGPPTATPTRTATPGAGMNGDANCDGNITSVDSLWVLWEVASIADITCPGGLANADANKDGNITSIDSALILQFVAELIDHLP